MKKLLGISLMLVILCLLFVGCSTAGKSQSSVSIKKEQVKTQAEDKSTTMIDNTVKFNNSLDISGKSVIISSEHINGADTSQNISEVVDLKQNSSSIIKGTIKKVEYIDYNSRPVTILSVLVTKDYKGKIQPNTLISVIKSGGYMSLKSFVDEREGKFTIVDDNKQNLSQFEIHKSDYEKGIMNEKSANDSITQVGDDNIYYLSSTDKNSGILQGCYRVTGGSDLGVFAVSGNTAKRYLDKGTEVKDTKKEQTGYSVNELVPNT